MRSLLSSPSWPDIDPSLNSVVDKLVDESDGALTHPTAQPKGPILRAVTLLANARTAVRKPNPNRTPGTALSWPGFPAAPSQPGTWHS